MVQTALWFVRLVSRGEQMPRANACQDAFGSETDMDTTQGSGICAESCGRGSREENEGLRFVWHVSRDRFWHTNAPGYRMYI